MLNMCKPEANDAYKSYACINIYCVYIFILLFELYCWEIEAKHQQENCDKAFYLSVQNYTEWTSWSECVNSTQNRTQACTATVSGNCINTETQACNETTNTSTLSTTPINIISSLQTTGRHTTATDGRLDTSTVHASTTSRTTTNGYSLDASTKHASTTSHTTTDGYSLDALTTHGSTTSHTTADGYSSDASTVHSSMTTHTITHSKIAQSKSKSVDVHSSNTPTGIATKGNFKLFSFTHLACFIKMPLAYASFLTTILVLVDK